VPMLIPFTKPSNFIWKAQKGSSIESLFDNYWLHTWSGYDRGSGEPDLRLLIKLLYPLKRQKVPISTQDYKEQQVDVRGDSWKRRYNRHLGNHGRALHLLQA
jgi:hypothetical protein